MPWRHMRLRGAKVLARCKEDGTLDAVSGRVEVRYKPNDGRAYRAAVSNLGADGALDVLPDDHCGPAQAPDDKKTASKGRKKGGKTQPAKTAATAPSKPLGNEVLVYADGACSGNPGPAGLGVVMLWDDQRRELSEFLGRGTNNIAELTAILRALQTDEAKTRPLHIYTDSQYSIGVLTKGWKAKANKELIATIRETLAGLDTTFFHVRGHAGIPLNERADELAVLAVESRGSPGWREA